MKRQIVCFLIITIATSFIEKKPQNVLLTFKNASKEDYKSLHVKIFNQNYFFQDLKSGKLTKAINVDKTYRYCFAEVVTAKDTIVLQPIDYVGETLYRNGSMTMELYIFPEDTKERELRIR